MTAFKNGLMQEENLSLKPNEFYGHDGIIGIFEPEPQP